MSYCPDCGHDNGANSDCIRCGARQPALVSDAPEAAAPMTAAAPVVPNPHVASPVQQMAYEPPTHVAAHPQQSATWAPPVPTQRAPRKRWAIVAVVVAMAGVMGVTVKVVLDRNSGPEVHPATRVVATIPVSDVPSDITTAPDGTAYVANSMAGTVSVISEDRVTATIPVGENAGALAVATDGTLYAVGINGLATDDQSDDELVIHLVRGGRDVATIQPGCGWYLAATSNGQIYCAANDSIMVIEGDKVVDSFSTVAKPSELAVAPDGTLYATSNGKVISKVTNGQATSSIAFQDYVQGLAVAPDGTLYVAHGDLPGVSVVRNGVVVSTIPISLPAGATRLLSRLAVGPDGTLYVASMADVGSAMVSVIRNNQVITTIPAQAGGRSLAVAHDGTVFVANGAANTVSVLR